MESFRNRGKGDSGTVSGFFFFLLRYLGLGSLLGFDTDFAGLLLAGVVFLVAMSS